MSKDSNNPVTKQSILEEIKCIAEQNGKPPGSIAFEKKTGIKPTRWQGIFWINWSDALKEAGFQPNTFNAAYPQDFLLECLANLTMELGHVPSKAELKYARKHKPGFPSAEIFYKRGGKDEIVRQLAEWVEQHEQFSDLAAIILQRVESSSSVHRDSRQMKNANVFTPLLSDSFVPPVIECLPSLAEADPELVRYCREMGLAEDNVFEKRVAIAFRILGLEVEELGQGKGRAADGIAKCRSRGWAVVYDAKVRSAGFRVQTEDRKFREYVETHTPILQSEGITNIYFAVISSAFTEDDLSRASEIVRLTAAKACVFLQADVLVNMVEMKVRDPLKFDLEKIERIFLHTKIVTPKDLPK